MLVVLLLAEFAALLVVAVGRLPHTLDDLGTWAAPYYAALVADTAALVRRAPMPMQSQSPMQSQECSTAGRSTAELTP